MATVEEEYQFLEVVFNGKTGFFEVHLPDGYVARFYVEKNAREVVQKENHRKLNALFNVACGGSGAFYGDYDATKWQRYYAAKSEAALVNGATSTRIA